MKQIRVFAILFSLILTSSAWASENPKEAEYRLAASIGDIDTVTRLLDEGININSGNQFGVTALMMAIQNNNIETKLIKQRSSRVGKVSQKVFFKSYGKGGSLMR